MKRVALFSGLVSAPVFLFAFVLAASVAGSGCGTGEDCEFIIKDNSLPDGVVGVGYSYDLGWSANGCFWKNDTENTIWTHSAGTLPPGISFNSDGKISGLPTQAGVFNMTFKVTYKSENEFSEVQKGFSITVRE